jgi:uncharacterized protein (TIGR02271 family)
MHTERPDEQTLELREEELVVHRDMRDVGEAHIRTRVEEVPARLEVDAYSEEVEVEHVPVGQVVSERTEPYQDGDVLIVPIYEEQLVVTKRLILREHLRVRRVTNTQRQLFEDTLRKERAEVDDPSHTGLVHEHYAEHVEGERVAQAPEEAEPEEADREQGGLVNLVRRALQ